MKTLKYWNIGDILDFCGIINAEKRAKKLEDQLNYVSELKKDMTQMVMPKELKGLWLSNLIFEKEAMNRHAKLKHTCDNS